MTADRPDRGTSEEPRASTEAEAERGNRGTETTPTRRSVLRGGAALGATAALPGLSGTALAHQETETGTGAGAGAGTGTGSDPAAKGAVTQVALPTDAPDLGEENYSGMFLHVSGPQERGERKRATSCGFVDQGETVIAYDATLIDRVDAGHPQAETVIFGLLDDGMLAPGKLYVINNVKPCSGDQYLTLQIEEIGASSIDVRSTETGGDGGGSDTTIPGFGVLTAGAAVLGGAAALARRDGGED